MNKNNINKEPQYTTFEPNKETLEAIEECENWIKSGFQDNSNQCASIWDLIEEVKKE